MLPQIYGTRIDDSIMKCVFLIIPSLILCMKNIIKILYEFQINNEFLASK